MSGACFECTRDVTADTQDVELDLPDFTESVTMV